MGYDSAIEDINLSFKATNFDVDSHDFPHGDYDYDSCCSSSDMKLVEVTLDVQELAKCFDNYDLLPDVLATVKAV